MEQQEARKLARWESRGGKYWVELFFNPSFKLANGQVVVDAHYRGNGCSGGISASTEQEAIERMQAEVDKGYFQADANQSPMKRTLYANQ